MNKIVSVFSDEDLTDELIRLALERVRLAEGVSPKLDAYSPKDMPRAYDEAKNADAMLFGYGAHEVIRALAKALNLHTCVRFNKEIALVTNCLGGIYGEGRHGFDHDPKFGRAAYDAEYLSELEIERTARVAYEYAEQYGKKLLLLDGGSELVTSVLWRKIVSDINEDYPSVPVKMCETCEFLRGYDRLDGVILASKLFGDIAWAALRAEGVTSIVGDTPFAIYSDLDSENILLSLTHMLTNCFTLEKGAQDLSNVLRSLPPHPSAHDVKSALQSGLNI